MCAAPCMPSAAFFSPRLASPRIEQGNVVYRTFCGVGGDVCSPVSPMSGDLLRACARRKVTNECVIARTTVPEGGPKGRSHVASIRVPLPGEA